MLYITTLYYKLFEMSPEDRLAFIEAQFLFVEGRNKVFDALGHFVVQNRCRLCTAMLTTACGGSCPVLHSSSSSVNGSLLPNPKDLNWNPKKLENVERSPLCLMCLNRPQQT